MTIENHVVLYVFSNEYEEAIGIYEDIEMSDFFNYYIKDVITSIEKHYTLYEKIEYHYEYIGLLMEFYKKYRIESDLEIDRFLKIYNEIAVDKLSYEKIEVEEEQQQVITNFIFEHGLDKYKRNRNEDLLPKVEVMWQKQNEDIILNRYVKDVDKIIKFILIQEIDRLYKDYCAEELLFEKTEYVKSLMSFVDDLNDFSKENIDVLINLQKVYNDEFDFSESEIIINQSRII